MSLKLARLHIHVAIRNARIDEIILPVELKFNAFIFLKEEIAKTRNPAMKERMKVLKNILFATCFKHF